MDVDRIAQICFGTGSGPTKPIPAEEGKPKPLSLCFTIMRNAMYVGYAYVSPDAKDPHQAAMDMGRRYADANEAWHGTPDFHNQPGTWKNYQRQGY